MRVVSGQVAMMSQAPAPTLGQVIATAAACPSTPPSTSACYHLPTCRLFPISLAPCPQADASLPAPLPPYITA